MRNLQIPKFKETIIKSPGVPVGPVGPTEPLGPVGPVGPVVPFTPRRKKDYSLSQMYWTSKQNVKLLILHMLLSAIPLQNAKGSRTLLLDFKFPILIKNESYRVTFIIRGELWDWFLPFMNSTASIFIATTVILTSRNHTIRARSTRSTVST